MTAAAPYDPATLARLTRDARAITAQARGVLGVEAGDLLSAGWLAYQHAAERGLGHAGCAARARYAMLDAVREWIGTPWDHKTGERLAHMVPVPLDTLTAPSEARGGTRTRLPRRIANALRTLTPRERTALHCWTVRGWSHELIADHLHTTEGTSGRLRHDALAKLRAAAGVLCDTPRHRLSSPSAGGVAPARTARPPATLAPAVTSRLAPS